MWPAQPWTAEAAKLHRALCLASKSWRRRKAAERLSQCTQVSSGSLFRRVILRNVCNSQRSSLAEVIADRDHPPAPHKAVREQVW